MGAVDKPVRIYPIHIYRHVHCRWIHPLNTDDSTLFATQSIFIFGSTLDISERYTLQIYIFQILGRCVLAFLLNQPVIVACKSKVVSPDALRRCMRTYVPSILGGTYIYKERFSNMKNSRVQIFRIETMGLPHPIGRCRS